MINAVAESKYDINKALFIGLNYKGTFGELADAESDCKLLYQYITGGYYSVGQSKLLVESGHEKPTRKSIIEHLNWLVSGNENQPNLFLYYAGHGGSINNSELGIFPCDNDPISAAELQNILHGMLPEGSLLTIIWDCKIGSAMLKLPFSYKYAEDEVQVTMSMDVFKKLGDQQTQGGNIILFAGEKERLGQSLLSLLEEMPHGSVTDILRRLGKQVQISSSYAMDPDQVRFYGDE